ncbi:ras-related protein Ral-A isoform X1 [Ovis aries]|uniref:ras-related protein Ral-A isoform X1 n=1 Tax=Ovis aries TaxID=9940 RepID=UPI001C2E490D|nr:ras-related protein Ral-A isoform X1 [Ovis aries]
MAASALPPPSKNPFLVPRRETRTSWRRDPGNSARPAATPGPPGGDFTSPAQRAGGGAAVKAVKPALNTQRVDTREPAPFGHCSPAPAPHPPLRSQTGSCFPAGSAPLPSAPEVIGGSCCRAARRRVDLLRAERPESSSTSSCRPGSTAACRTPFAAPGAEPPRLQERSTIRLEPAQPRLPEPTGLLTGLPCRSPLQSQSVTCKSIFVVPEMLVGL